ncbi:MAG: Ig-like domain-containing protein [Methanobrevibacter sp.]|nr:Ig-like domain-containing protein [Methanobrevibacter sp.]
MAVFTVDKLPVGKYDIVANYTGDANYTSRVETLVQGLEVIKVQNYEINVTAVDVHVGENTTITIHVPKDATGTVTVWVNGTEKVNSTIVEGVATVQLNKTLSGRYVVNATLTDAKYADQTVYTTYWVSKVEPSMVIDVVTNDIKVGDTVEVTVTLPTDIDNEVVTLEINGEIITNTTAGGIAKFYIDSVTYGNKTVVASYAGNDKYAFNSTTKDFTVTKRDSQVNITVVSPINVGDNTTITVKVPANATGYVVVNVNGNNYTVNLTDGEGSVEIAGLKNETYKVTATYLGDGQYLSSINKTGEIKVNKVDSTVNLTVSDNGIIANGTDVNITVKAPVDVTGKVTITLWNGTQEIKSYTVYINDGEGVLHLDSPVVGIYNVTATYLANDKYKQSENKTSFEVFATSGELTVISPSAFVNQNNMITVQIAGRHEGEITFIITNASGVVVKQNATITPGDTISKAELELDLLAAGKYDVKAIFNEINGTKTTVHEGTGSFNIYKLASQIKIKELNATIKVGEDETITLEIELDARADGGNISIFINGVEYNTTTSKLTVEIPDLNATDYDVIAIYHGNSWYNESDASATFKVIKNPTPIDIKVTNSTVGSVEQINVTVPGDATGQILLDIGGKHYYANITEGVAQFNITCLKAGEHEFNVTYLGNYKYLANNTNATLKVSKLQPAFAVNGTNITVGDSELIKFETAENITGIVKVEIGGRNYTAFVNEGKGNLTVYHLAAGEYNVTVYFAGNEKYLNASAKNKFKVSQTNADIRIITQNITYGGTETITVYVNATGNVTITVGDKVFEEKVLENGFVTVNVTGLGAGRHSVDVTYNGNANLTTKDATAYFNVSKAAPSVDVSVENITYYDTEHITVTVNTGGNVTIKVNGNVVAKDVVLDVNNSTIVPVTGLKAGVYDVEVIYNGNKNYTSGTANAVFKVAKADVTVDVEVDNINVNGKEIINVTISNVNATGNVIINVDGKNYTQPISGGKASLTLDKLTNGTHSVVVIYEGDANLTGNWTSDKFTVDRLASELTITLTNTTVDKTETIKVNVTAGATGQVIITVDGVKHYVTIGNDGYATLVLDNLENKTYNVHAEYLGDANYTGSTGDASFNVAKIQSTVTVKVDNITVGDVAAVNIIVITGATGNVTIKIGNEYVNTVGITDGVISVIVPGLTVGNKTVEVTYNGNEKYLTSSDSANFTVAKTTSDIKLVVGNVTYGEKVPVTIFVNGTGTVTIKVDGTAVDETIPIVDGKVEYEISGLPAGNYTVEVTYNGNDDINSTTAEAEFEVAKADPTINVKVEDIVYGNVEYIIITSNAKGKVNVTVNGITKEVSLDEGRIVLRASMWAVPDEKGKATVEVPDLAAGKYPVTVEYGGNDNYNKATATAVFNVIKENTTVDVKVAPSIKVGETQVINITVNNVNATGNVTINIDGVNYTAELTNGRANFTTPKLASGNHTVNVIYDGDKNLTGNWTSAIFEVTKLDAPVSVEIQNCTVGGKQTITVTVPDDATGQVLIDINGQHYYANVTGGKATLELNNLPADDYTVVATYLGDENYTAKSADSATFKVNKNNSTLTIETQNIAVGDNEVIIFNVPEDATGNITVKVAGKTYTVAVSGGKGNLTVPKLHRGDYTVEATYNGDDKYLPSNSTATFKVAKHSVEMEVVDEGNKTVVVALHENATGKVTIKLGNQTYNATVENGVAVIILTNATPGTHTIDVIYSGDDDYASQTQKASVHIPTYTTPMNVTVEDIKVGDKAIVVVNVPANATGNVTIEVDGVKYTTDNITDGVARFEVGNLTAGNKTIAVVYAGDDAYASNYTTGNFSVEKRTPTVTPVITPVGEDVEITVNVPENATGYVIVSVDNETYAVKVNDGVAKTTVRGLSSGNHNINVTYTGDDQYKSSDVFQDSVNIASVPSSVSVKVDNITYGDKAIVEVTVPTDATGNVTVTIGDKSYNVTVSGGKGILVVPGIEAGNYTIDVRYNGDDKYRSSTNSTEFEVAKEALTPDDVKVIDQGNGTVVVVVPENATGNVTVKVGDKEYNATVVNGTAVVNVTDLAPGEHEIEVIYPGDNNYNGTSTKGKVTVPKHDTPMSVSVENIKVGQNGEINVNVPKDANGNVTIEIDGVKYSEEIKDGKATFTIENLTAGTKTIAVDYAGDNNFTANHTTANITVSKNNPEVNIDVTSDGDNAIIDITAPKDVTRPVLVDVDGVGYYVNITDGKGQLVIPGLSGGNHDVTARYLGDDKYGPSAIASKSFEIESVPSSVSVKVDNITYGDKAVVEVTVPSDATGNVTIKIGDKEYTVPVSGGKGVLVVPDLGAGNYTVEATYNGDDKYDSSSNSTELEVVKEKVTPDDVKVIDQGNGTVAVVVPENTTGNITVKVGNETYTAPIVDGKAIINMTNATPGEHEIEVIYPGDDNHDGTSTTSKVTVPKQDTPVTVTVENIKVGDKATVTVNVPDNATGNVTVEIDGVTYTAPIKDGKATFEIADLKDGNKSIFVSYDGDSNYNANTTTAQFSVDKNNATITATINDIGAGENLTVTVKLPDDATGQVLIDIDGVGYYVNVTNGTGTCEIPHLSSGNYNVTLTYTGDDKYASSSTSKSFKVEKVESFVIPTAVNIVVGENENIKLLVPSDATGNVTVIIDGTEYNYNLDDDTLSAVSGEGKYTVAVSGGNGVLVISGLPQGEYYVTVRYNGDQKYLPAVNATMFTVSKIDSTVDVVDLGNGTVRVVVPNDATGTVTVKVGNKTYTAEVKNGTADVTIDESTPGVHEIEVTYSGDKDYASKTVNSTVVVPKYDAPIYASANNVSVGQTQVVVVNVPGKATGTVTVEVDGKSYTAEVKDGKAEVKITDLDAGKKTAVVKYSGDDSYSENLTSLEFNVEKVKKSISAFGKDVVVGKDEVIVVSLPKDATGQVLVEINGVGYYADVVNGVARITIPKLPAGKYNAKLTYTGDDKYEESSTTVSFTVKKASSSISATADEITVGEDEKITVKLPSDATGTVTVTIDGKKYTATVSNGKAVIVIPGLPAGVYDAVIVYSGDAKYNSSTSMVRVVVNEDIHNETNNRNASHEIPVDVKEGISLSDYPTGNPLWILLLVLLAIGSNEFRRRFRK